MSRGLAEEASAGAFSKRDGPHLNRTPVSSASPNQQMNNV